MFQFVHSDATNVENIEKRIVFKENDIICYCMVHNELKKVKFLFYFKWFDKKLSCLIFKISFSVKELSLYYKLRE